MRKPTEALRNAKVASAYTPLAGHLCVQSKFQNRKSKIALSTPRLPNVSVLIVDDDEDILSSIELAMRAEGAITAKAADGSAAVLACQTSPPDAVVLDMMLPKASGFVVMEKIREMANPPVVVMVTANQGKRHQHQRSHANCNHYAITEVEMGDSELSDTPQFPFRQMKAAMPV